MKEKIVILDLDDIHPQEGYGLNKDKSVLKYVKKLNQVFGLKATFFIPLDWFRKYPLHKHKDWVGWIKRFQNYGHEIAAHGFFHMNPNKGMDDMEFLMYNETDTDNILRQIKEAWGTLGVDVKGIRYPGWGETKFTEKLTGKYFEYCATHMVGEKPIISYSGTYKTPYNILLNELKDNGQDVYIIHGHVSSLKESENNLSLKLYLELVEFLNKLEKKYIINYMTHRDYVQHIKQLGDTNENKR